MQGHCDANYSRQALALTGHCLFGDSRLRHWYCEERCFKYGA